MKLATSANVTSRMGSNVALGNVATAADSVLEACTHILENIIGTPFESAERIDWFDYRPSLFATDVAVILNLTQAFVEGNVTVYFSTDGNPVLQDFSNAEAVDSGSIDLDQEKGIADVLTVPYEGTSTVAVKYSAGFTEGSADIPDWLREAVISAAVRMIHSQVIGHNKRDIRDMSPELHRILYMGCSHRIRGRLHGIFPKRTKVL
jgi:hypothetical protein